MVFRLNRSPSLILFSLLGLSDPLAVLTLFGPRGAHATERLAEVLAPTSPLEELQQTGGPGARLGGGGLRLAIWAQCLHAGPHPLYFRRPA